MAWSQPKSCYILNKDYEENFFLNVSMTEIHIEDLGKNMLYTIVAVVGSNG